MLYEIMKSASLFLDTSSTKQILVILFYPPFVGAQFKKCTAQGKVTHKRKKIKIRRQQEFIDVIGGTTYRVIRRLFGTTQRIKNRQRTRLSTTVLFLPDDYLVALIRRLNLAPAVSLPVRSWTKRDIIFKGTLFNIFFYYSDTVCLEFTNSIIEAKEKLHFNIWKNKPALDPWIAGLFFPLELI